MTADRGVGEHRHHVGLHFENAASDEDEFFAAIGLLDANCTGLDARDQRRVLGQNAQLARLTGQRDELRLARENRRFRADDVYVDG